MNPTIDAGIQLLQVVLLVVLVAVNLVVVNRLRNIEEKVNR